MTDFTGGNQNNYGPVSVAGTIHNYQPPKNKPSTVFFNVKDPSEGFIGRETILQQLFVAALNNQQNVGNNKETHATVLSQIQIVTGTAGVGKTEIVRKFIHLYKNEYDNIVWIDSENFSTARSCFVALAKELKVNFSQFNNSTTYRKSKIRKIYSILCRKKSLIVFDNADSYNDDQDSIQCFFPSSVGPKQVTPTIIITSQNNTWSSSPIRTLPIQINPLTRNEAVTFIREQLAENNEKMADKLAHMFSCLPLALTLAIKLIQKQSKLRQVELGKRYSISKFIKDIKMEKVCIHGEQSENAFTVWDIWKVTLSRITNLTTGGLAIHHCT